MKTENKYYVYCHFRLDTMQPFYFGVGTKNSNGNTLKAKYSRAFSSANRNIFWKRVNKKYGKHVYIVFESSDQDQCFEKEKYYIALYGKRCAGGGILTNISDGGEGTPGVLTRGYEVSSYDENGVKMKTFLSINEASRFYEIDFSQIARCCKGIFYHAGGIRWALGREDNIVIKYRKPRGKPKIKVVQITESGDTIKIFPSFMEAAKELKINDANIRACCRGKRKHTKGTYWRYLGEGEVD